MAHDLIVCKRRPKSEVGWGGGRREAEIREKMAPYEEMRQFSFTLSKIPAHLFHGPYICRLADKCHGSEKTRAIMM